MSETKDVPSVTLGGKTFPVPELSARRIIRFSKLLTSIPHFDLPRLTEEQITDFYNAVHIGLGQGTPDLMSFDDFMELPISYGQLIAAIQVIGKQAGMEFGTPGETTAKADAATPSTPPSLPNGGTTQLQTS